MADISLTFQVTLAGKHGYTEGVTGIKTKHTCCRCSSAGGELSYLAYSTPCKHSRAPHKMAWWYIPVISVCESEVQGHPQPNEFEANREIWVSIVIGKAMILCCMHLWRTGMYSIPASNSRIAQETHKCWVTVKEASLRERMILTMNVSHTHLHLNELWHCSYYPHTDLKKNSLFPGL